MNIRRTPFPEAVTYGPSDSIEAAVLESLPP
jgi:hypothetical protein